ncbi:IclR family transcriptional regulator C-terminal domain-containing protein [Actinomycetospora sp. NBRC 106375]|uniref:IclR family transcriptional regulator domain-containing protein n=1 Tax=Actinomycetospora sp. NBRC 106375 TaxID=3032207 RepID=UPI0025567DC1|nr:IclR family transcriptional regulator C-terminal domain-containing protein [Actinomycetospora sp. NBRC 106375]
MTSLARGLDVLRSFGPQRPEQTIGQVADATGLSPAVARRFLLTLVALGYLAQVDRRFVLTPRVLELGASYPDSMDLAGVAQPHLQQVRDETRDSVSLTALSGTDVIHLVHLQTERLLRFAVTQGSRVPAYVSATGRAILATLPDDRLDAYFATAELAPRTPSTVTDEGVLREELRSVRSAGYALVVDELDAGITVLGVPVVPDGRTAVAGISCAIASGLCAPEAFVASRLPLLQRAAESLAGQIARSPALRHSLAPPG